MALEEFGMFRALPDSHVFYPCDAVSTERAVEIVSNLKGKLINNDKFIFL